MGTSHEPAPPGALDDRYLGRLTDGVDYRVTSPKCDEYNCIGWVIRDQATWWDPDRCWPFGLGDDFEAYCEFFRLHGFDDCTSPESAPGREKIAIYALAGDFTHVAYQRPDGQWSSKLGMSYDLRHTAPDTFEVDPELGTVVHFMCRPRQPHENADGAGLLLPDGIDL